MDIDTAQPGTASDTPTQLFEVSAKPRLQPVISIKQIAWFDDRFYRVTLWDDTVRNIPSVTTKLRVLPKPFIAKWRGDVGNEVADRRLHDAGERGTRVHHACYMYATGGGVIFSPPKYKGMEGINKQADALAKQFDATGTPYIVLQNEDEVLMVQRFRDFMAALNPTILGAEVVLYSLNMNAAGTADYILTIPGGDYAIAGAKPMTLPAGTYLLDLKSGQEDADHFIQLAAYTAMYEESTGTPIVGGLMVYLNADTKTGIPGLQTRFKTREQINNDLRVYEAASLIYDNKYGNDTPKDLTIPLLIYRREIPNAVPNDFVQSNQVSPIKKVGEKVEPMSDEDAAANTPASAPKKRGRPSLPKEVSQ
jgi:hypothetical protein